MTDMNESIPKCKKQIRTLRKVVRALQERVLEYSDELVSAERCLQATETVLNETRSGEHKVKLLALTVQTI